MADKNVNFNVNIKQIGAAAVEKALKSIVSVGKSIGSSLKTAFGSATRALFSLKSALLGLIGVGGLGALIANTSATIDQIGKLSKSLGVSTEQLGVWRYAADLSGTSIEGVAKAMALMSRGVQDFVRTGSGPAADAMNILGIKTSDLSPILNNTNELFKLFADKLAQLPDGAKKTALAMDLFGESGKVLIPLLNEGSAGFTNLTDEAEKMGLTMSGDVVKGVERANDALTKFRSRLMGLFSNVVAASAPAIEDFFNTVSDKFSGYVAKQGGVREFAKSIALSFVEGFESISNSLIDFINGFRSFSNELKVVFSDIRNFFSKDDNKIRVFASKEEFDDAKRNAQEHFDFLLSQYTKLKFAPKVSMLADLGGGIKIKLMEKEIHDAKAALDDFNNDLIQTTELLPHADFSNVRKTIDEAFVPGAEKLSWFNDGLQHTNSLIESEVIKLEQAKKGWTLYFENLAKNEEAKRALLLSIDPSAALGEAYARRSQMIDQALSSELITEQRAAELKLQIQRDYFSQLAAMEGERFKYSIDITSMLGKAQLDSWESNGNMFLSHMQSTMQAASGISKRAFELNKAFSIANAIVSGAEAAVNAYAFGAKFGGPPLGAAFAAAAAGATALQINAIRQAKFNSGGGGGGSIGGLTSAPTTSLPSINQIKQSPTIQVTIIGDVSGEEVVNKVTESIKSRLGNDEVFFDNNTAQAQVIRG